MLEGYYSIQKKLIVKISVVHSLKSFLMAKLGGEVTWRDTQWMNLCQSGKNPTWVEFMDVLKEDFYLVE